VASHPLLPRRARARARARAGIGALAAVVALGAALTACSHDGRTLAPAKPDQTQSIASTSTSTTTGAVIEADFTVYAPWEPGAAMPVDQSCDGAGVAPSITWAGIPPGTAELALVMTDLDDAGAVHWLVAGIDPTAATSISGSDLPAGAVEGMTTGGTAGYAPVCPQPGATHRYTIDLYALVGPSAVTTSMTAADALSAIQAQALGQASVTGTYER
jgi:Raf kinase inhibitor-like YbhB/YbcL family protein